MASADTRSAPTRTTQVCDVVVVGGGVVARLYVWRLLAAGLRVVWADPAFAQRAPRDRGSRPAEGATDPRRVALARASVETLARMGLDLRTERQAFGEDDLRDAEIRRIEVSRAGAMGRCRLQAGADAEPNGATPALGLVVELPALEALLDQRIDALADPSRMALRRVPMLAADDFTWCDPGAARSDARVRVSSGAFCIEARLVIAADGAASTWRARVGIEADTRDFAATALVGDVNTTRCHGGWAFERFTDRGPLALLPAGSRRMNLVWALDPEQAQRLAGDADAIAARLAALFGRRLGTMRPAQRLGSFPLRRVVARRGYARGVLLAGNAWHALHPVAGQGLNLTLRDLAAFDAALTGSRHPVDWIGDPTAIDAWARVRQADVVATTRVTDALGLAFLVPGGSASDELGRGRSAVSAPSAEGASLRWPVGAASAARILGGLALAVFDRLQGAPTATAAAGRAADSVSRSLSQRVPGPIGERVLRQAGGLARDVHPWAAVRAESVWAGAGDEAPAVSAWSPGRDARRGRS